MRNVDLAVARTTSGYPDDFNVGGFMDDHVIKVNEVVTWSAQERSECAELGIGQINVAVRNLRSSIEFYARVFGFSASAVYSARGSAVMNATARADLLLHERRDRRHGSLRALRRWGFVVTDLDRVRQLAWELGVRVARDSGAPDHIYQWSNRRSLYIHDPDGNEIELAELTGDRRSRCGPMRAAPCSPIAARLEPC
jgi:catechol-2,3-dioxygenase